MLHFITSVQVLSLFFQFIETDRLVLDVLSTFVICIWGLQYLHVVKPFVNVI